jgi:hypothetical protein
MLGVDAVGMDLEFFERINTPTASTPYEVLNNFLVSTIKICNYSGAVSKCRPCMISLNSYQNFTVDSKFTPQIDSLFPATF